MLSNELGDVQTLKDFRSSTGRLTRNDQKTIVEMAIMLLEQSYVHLPLKVAMHAVNPIRRLRILQNRLEEVGLDTINHELDFHEEMLDIFTSLRDLHTNYLLPDPFSNCFAILPFFIESYVKEQHTTGEKQREIQFIVTGILSPDRLKDFLPPNFDFHIPTTFKRGVEITYWNGVPMKRAVDINANKKAGSNSAARFKRGLEDMTIRPMSSSLPPDEEWVVIGYRTEDGQDLEYRQEWLVVSRNPEGVTKEGLSRDAKSIMADYSLKIGMDFTTDSVRKMKKIMFAPQNVIESERILAKSRSLRDLVKEDEGLDSRIKSVFKAEKISDDIGYIRIFTFSGDKPEAISDIQWVDAMVEEFRRLLTKLPKKGLIIDVRKNGGGYIPFAERILQFLTPQEVTPQPYSFISSLLTRELTGIFASDPAFKYWNTSISEALTTGSIFSGGYAITNRDAMNIVGQVYHGPVILVTDALCYSATDLFAASFQDHKIGDILGVDENTGAGGANVWEYEDLSRILVGSRYELKQIPYGPFRLSIRRNVRTREHSGTPVEDLGVKPDIVYNMTRRDLLEENVDLIKKATEILAGKEVKQLEAAISDQNGSLKIDLDTIGISRIDIYVDNRPVISQDVIDGTSKLSINKTSTGARVLKIVGIKGNTVVAVRKIFL